MRGSVSKMLAMKRMKVRMLRIFHVKQSPSIAIRLSLMRQMKEWLIRVFHVKQYSGFASNLSLVKQMKARMHRMFHVKNAGVLQVSCRLRNGCKYGFFECFA